MIDEQNSVAIRDLTVSQSGRKICRVDSLSIPPQGRVVIRGSNGTGKTTLLRVLAGLENRFAGRCEVQPPVRDRVFVHQTPFLFRGTVLSNVTYGIRARGLLRTETQIEEWIDLFRLGKLKGQRARHLSGGERRRVALARAMVLEPQLLLLDEPTSDLDCAGADAVRIAMERLPNSTIVVASPTEFGRQFGFVEYELS